MAGQLGEKKRVLLEKSEELEILSDRALRRCREEYEAVEEEKVIRPELHPATDSLSMGEVVRAVSEATRHEAI